MAWHGVACSPSCPKSTQALGPECALTRVMVGPPSWHMIRQQALLPPQSDQTITNPCSAFLHGHSCCALTHAPPQPCHVLNLPNHLNLPNRPDLPLPCHVASCVYQGCQARQPYRGQEPASPPPAHQLTRPPPQGQHLPHQPSGHPVPTANYANIELASP